MGRKLVFGWNTNINVDGRLRKAKGAWWIIKKSIFLDKEIRPRIKPDIVNASVGSIMRYIATTIATTEAPDREMQCFASKCIRGVIIGSGDIGNNQNISNWYLRYNSNIATILTKNDRQVIWYL